MELLDRVGEDLAVLVGQNNLPTVSLEEPTIGRYTLFEHTLLVFHRTKINSPILVGGDSEFTKAYFNTLALMMSQKDTFKEMLSHNPKLSHPRVIDRLVSKRLRTLHIQQLLLLHSNTGELKDLFLQIIAEAKKRDYFFVINQLQLILPLHKSAKEHYSPLYESLFLGIRSYGLVFTTAMSWVDYVKHLEHNLPALSRFCPIIPLSPRPHDLLSNR